MPRLPEREPSREPAVAREMDFYASVLDSCERSQAEEGITRTRQARCHYAVILGDMLTAEALRLVLRGSSPLANVRILTSGNKALRALKAKSVELAVVGLSLPDIDGLDVLLRIAEERLSMKIIALLQRRDERARDLLKTMHLNGIFDATSQTLSEFNAAARMVLGGAFYCSPTFRKELWEPGSSKIELRHMLSQTEMQVFSLIGDGLRDDEAAMWMGLSTTTIHTHRQHIMRKLGVQTRAELMKEAIQRGVIRITSKGTLRPGLERVLAERRENSRSPFPTTSTARNGV